MKKICIICSNISDSTSPRTMRVKELVDEFYRNGHKITIITATSSNINNWLIKPSQNVEIISFGKIEKIQTPIKKLLEKYLKGLLYHLFLYPDIFLTIKVYIALLKLKSISFDLLLSIATPHPIHWGVALLSINKRKSISNLWVADCGDPFYLVKTSNRKRPFYFKYIEKWTFRKVDSISIPVHTAKEGYFPEFWNKLVVIPQGINFSDIKIQIGEVSNPKLTFIYAGGFLKIHRDPTNFLLYLEAINKDFEFIIYTKGGYEFFFKNLSYELKNKIKIRSYIPRKELIFEMSKADFIINFENGTNIQMPSKLIDYGLSKRPILSVDTRDLNYRVIDEFFEKNYTNQYLVENIEQFDIQNVTKSFLALLKN
jgi:hypothetical protein